MDRRLGPICKRLSVKDAAYIAGIIDGEGCISIIRKKDPTMRGGYGYRPWVSVANTKIELAQYLTKTTGVGLTYHTKPHNPRSKQGHTWQLWSRQACSVLEQVLPHLRLKRTQAQITIAFIKTCSQKYGIRGLPPEVRAYKERVHLQMKQLNKRGL